MLTTAARARVLSSSGVIDGSGGSAAGGVGVAATLKGFAAAAFFGMAGAGEGADGAWLTVEVAVVATAGAADPSGASAAGRRALGAGAANSIATRAVMPRMNFPIHDSAAPPRSISNIVRYAKFFVAKARPSCYIWWDRDESGISLMVEHQFSKLGAPVRFRYPAHNMSEVRVLKSIR